jgi:hypothetical protein
MRTRNFMALVIGLVVACGGSSSSSSSTSDAPPSPEPARTLAESVEVDDVAVLQGTTATLLSDAKVPKKQNAPVIAGRPALIRVHARRIEGVTTRLPSLAAELHLQAQGTDVVLRDGPKAVVELDPTDLSTTFDFEVDGSALTPDAAFTITLSDPTAPDIASASFPADGSTFALHASADAPTVRVRFVPIRYDEDGSQRLPSLDSAIIESHRRALLSMYPARDVEISVREPLPWAGAVEAQGKGWDELLDAIVKARDADGADDDIYYVGVFEPQDSIQDYCDGPCILGVAPLTGLDEVGLRVAMVVGYPTREAEGTLAQELAHAMGRDHAPCGGADAPDADFPYARASIGVPGWNIFTKELVDPTGRIRDFMGYCSPVWISDYTYSGLFGRMADVAKSKRVSKAPGRGGSPGSGGFGGATRVRSFHVGADGSMREGPRVEILRPIAKGSITVHYEDAAGHAVSVENAAFRPFDTVSGGILLAPEPPARAVRVRVEGLAARALRIPGR